MSWSEGRVSHAQYALAPGSNIGALVGFGEQQSATGGGSTIDGTTAIGGNRNSSGGSSSPATSSCVFHGATSGRDTNNGSTWSLAFANVQPALTASAGQLP